MDAETVRHVVELERLLDKVMAMLPAIGAQFIPLTTSYTNTNFDGDSFSDVGSNTKIDNADWSTTIPTNAKAILIRMAGRDSGSAGATSCYFALYSTAAAATAAATLQLGGVANDAIHEAHVIVPCTDGDIWYQVEATGASTFDAWLWVIGYWI